VAVVAALAALGSNAMAQWDAEAQAMINKLEREMLNMQTQIQTLKSQVNKTETEVKEIKGAPGVSPEYIPPKVTRSGKSGVSLTVSGNVIRSVLIYDDGEDSDVGFIEPLVPSTRIRFIGDGKFNDVWSVQTAMEFQFQSNTAFNFSQDDQHASGFDASISEGFGRTGVSERRMELIVKNTKLGKVFLGMGECATDGFAQKDQTGTFAAATSAAVADMAAGLTFVDEATNELSGTVAGTGGRVRIRNAYNQLDSCHPTGRDDRLRYDSPWLFQSDNSGFKVNGLQIRMGAVADDTYDIGAFIRPAVSKDLRMEAAIGYLTQNGNENLSIAGFGANFNRLFGSFTTLHIPTGLSFAFSSGRDDFQNVAGRDNPWYYFTKVGYQFNAFTFGKTATAIDWYNGENFTEDGSDSNAFGIFLLQNIDKIATEAFIGGRYHWYDENARNFKDIFAMHMGARVKF
jgi:hypothetical protein